VPDLATQLRLLAYPLTDIYDLSDKDRQTLIAAADEIERLRAERNSLSMQLDLVRAYL